MNGNDYLGNYRPHDRRARGPTGSGDDRLNRDAESSNTVDPRGSPNRPIYVAQSTWEQVRGYLLMALFAVGTTLFFGPRKSDDGPKFPVLGPNTDDYVPPPEPSPFKVERYVDTTAVWKNFPHAMQALNRDLLSGTSRTSYGCNKPVAYVVLPRNDAMAEYLRESYRGLDGLHLREVCVPSSIPPNELNRFVNSWALHCKTSPGIIRAHSSFQENASRWPLSRRGTRKLVNQCRPGGRCLVLSDECNGLADKEFHELGGVK